MLLVLLKWFTAAGVCAKNDATGQRLVAGACITVDRMSKSCTDSLTD